MAQLLSSLDVIDVASPCPANWNAMTGDERVRHCAQCDLNVYDLSDLSHDDAIRLIHEKEGQLCVRFFRRADGTVLTRDCPVGLRAVRLKLARMWTTAVAMAGALFCGSLFSRSARAERPAPEAPPVHLTEVKGNICIHPAPDVQVSLMVQLLTPEQTVTLLKTILEREASQPQGMPDPSDTQAPAEIERQTLAERLSDPEFVVPASGSEEHKQLVIHLSRFLKKYPDLAPKPAALLAPIVPDIKGEMLLGRLMVPRGPALPLEKIRLP